MIGALENAIIGALRAQSEAGALGYQYRLLDTYPDDFDQYFADKKGLLRAPAAWCTFLALDDCQDLGDGQGVQGIGRFALILAAQNLRNEAASRHGGPDGQSEPGSYQLAEDAVRILSDNWLADDPAVRLIRPLSVAGIRLIQRTEMMAKNNLSLMAVELRCTFPLGRFTGDDEGFEQLHIDWDVPPIGNVAPPLPAARADARDDIAVLQ